MRIEATWITPPSQASIERKEGLSKTDMKTHALVVLSYLLIGIGILIACSSPYIAFTIHPMVALSAPVVPIALGVLGLQNFGLMYVRGQPSGIYNAGANCWVNAGIHLLENACKDELTKLKVPSPQGPHLAMLPLLSACNHHQLANSSVSSANSQKVREWLHRGNPDISLNPYVQEDPISLLEHFCSLTKSFLPVMQQVGNGEIQSLPEFYIPITPDKNRPFRELFGEFFTTTTDRGVVIRKWFEVAPKGFIVQSKCFDFNDEDGQKKVTTPTRFPMKLELTKAQSPSGSAKYTPDSFIVHESNIIQRGHYVAYVKRAGRWWEVSDEKVRWISHQEATNKLHLAYLVHYAKGS